MFVEGVDQPTEQLVSFECRKEVYTQDVFIVAFKILFFFSIVLDYTHKVFCANDMQVQKHPEMLHLKRETQIVIW